MPNHTDVRAYFIGPPEAIRALRRAMRQTASSLDAPRAGAAGGGWNGILREAFPKKALEGPFGGLPGLGAQTPFTLQAGRPMPPELMVEEGSEAQFGQDMLSGAWEKYQGYMAYSQRWSEAGVRDAASALAWAREHEPEALRLGQIRLDNIKNHGSPSWYEWSVRCWGTKWDAYEQRWGEPKRQGAVQEVCFETAWSPPLPALAAMCERFGVDCAVGYVDEGGGFASFSALRANGEHALDVEDHCAAPRALWPRVRKEAKALWDARREAGALGPKGRSKKERPPEWLAAMDRGDEPDAELIKASSRAWLGGSHVADTVFDRLGADGPLDAPKAYRWLRALSDAGALSPSDALSSGEPIGVALSAGRWKEGFVWALEGAEESSKAGLIRLGAERSIHGNAPGMAALAYGLLEPGGRPTPEQIDFQLRPEAYREIAMSETVSRDLDLMERFYHAAQGAHRGERWLEAFKVIERAVERARIDGATGAGKATPARPGL